MSEQRLELEIEGMTCEHCVRAVRGRLEKTPGVQVESVQIGAAAIRYDDAKVSMNEIEDAISDEGYTVNR